jgi:hypothetical protein
MRPTLLFKRKKKYLWFRFPADPIFFCRPHYFFNAIDCATLFSPGGCGLFIQRAKMASVVTLIIEPNCLNSSIGNLLLILMSGLYCKSPSKKPPKPWKKYSKNIYFRPTDPNFFTIWNWNHRYFFLRLTLCNARQFYLSGGECCHSICYSQTGCSLASNIEILSHNIAILMGRLLWANWKLEIHKRFVNKVSDWIIRKREANQIVWATGLVLPSFL